MKMCDKHWPMLRKAIEDEGLGKFIGNSDSVRAEVEAAAAGEPLEDSKGFDPLFRANSMIMSAAVKNGGLYLLTGDYCPICEAIKHTSGTPREGETEPAGEEWVERHWTVGVAQSIRGYMSSLGLLPPAQ